MSQLPKVTDQGIEKVVSILLRTGVLVSGSVVLAGGIYFLAQHAGEHVEYGTFHGAAVVDRSLAGIVTGLAHLRTRSVIQLGIALLVATPILRVAFSLVGFAFERDWAYVAITAIVLAILLFSLLSGYAGG